jgi:adenylate cyclase class 2
MRPARKREIEIKLRAAGQREALRKLEAIGAKKVRSVRESNTLFDSPHATLRKRGELLRVRIEEPRGRGKRRCVLTFKGPSERSVRYKVRPEEEFEFGNHAEVRSILAQLGLQPVFRYEKTRTTYRIPGVDSVQVELDEVPFGVFFELEGPKRGIDRVARLLGYGPKDYIARSYLALHAEDCRRRGVPIGDMLFSEGKSR